MVETAAIVSGILSNGIFIGTTAFFVKRWMDKVDKNTELISAERRTDAKELADDLKASVILHQVELKGTAEKLEGHLDRIYEQMRIANGRTAKIEGGLQTIREVCAERHKNGDEK
jgi:hypothetical protein